MYCRKQGPRRSLGGLRESCDNKVVSANNVWAPISSYWKIETVSRLSILVLLMVLRKESGLESLFFSLLPTSVFISSYTLPLMVTASVPFSSFAPSFCFVAFLIQITSRSLQIQL